MNRDRETIRTLLAGRMNRTADRIRPPFMYLDPEAALYIYRELTGLADLPGVVFGAGSGTEQPEFEVTFDGRGREASDQLVFEAMWPVVREKTPLVENAEQADLASGGFGRVRGLLQSTHFPDGNLNLEIVFGDVRGVLFFNTDHFSSVVRPLVGNDRFHTLTSRVEALVFLHGPVQRMIFYHQSYGDNQEHAWLPLAPVAVMDDSDAEGEVD